jgi:hypothetical protein
VIWGASAQAIELEGYYKNIFIHSETVIGGKTFYWWDVNRLRLDLSQSYRNIEMNLVYDNEIQVGSYLDTSQFRLLADIDDPRYWDLQGTTLDRGDVYGSQELYRGTLKVAWDQLDMRVGRQQINWAVAAIWNPMDRFNPLNPLTLERDERQGVDALLLDLYVDDLSRLSIAYAPQHQSSKDSGAVRYKSNIGMFDWSVMLGEFVDEKKLGIGASGQVGLIGVRSELVYSAANDADSNDVMPQEQYVEWVFGADYTTHNGFTFMVEGYFNGDGESDPARYDFNAVVAGEKLGVGRRYLGVRVAKDVTPLLAAEIYAIQNVDDQSYFIFPSITYSLADFDSLYLGVGAQLFEGGSGDEYDFYNNLYFAEMKVYF